MSDTAYCDVLVPRNKRHGSLAEYKYTYCGCEMECVDGWWICPKHGAYVAAVGGQRGLDAYETHETHERVSG